MVDSSDTFHYLFRNVCQKYGDVPLKWCSPLFICHAFEWAIFHQWARSPWHSHNEYIYDIYMWRKSIHNGERPKIWWRWTRHKRTRTTQFWIIAKKCISTMWTFKVFSWLCFVGSLACCSPKSQITCSIGYDVYSQMWQTHADHHCQIHDQMYYAIYQIVYGHVEVLLAIRKLYVTKNPQIQATLFQMHAPNGSNTMYQIDLMAHSENALY